jgi:hypothetical protein
MTKTQEEIDKMKENLIYFIENLVKIKDKDGNLLDFKLSKTQLIILEGIIQNGFKKFQIVSSSRIRKGYRL